jgi:hypothetical protein
MTSLGLQSIIDSTNVLQDIELSTAINQLKTDPAKLQAFLQNQQTQVYSDIIKQKDGTFQKVYGDMQRAGKVQEAILMQDRRSKELLDVEKQVYENQKNSADGVKYDRDMATRKNEMNEWSIGNKNDTLFVFSSLFIALSSLLLITVLWRMGFMSTWLWSIFAVPIIIIFVLIVVVRSQYTEILRNKRYWNKKRFDGSGKAPVPMCPDVTDAITSGISTAQQSVGSAISQARESTMGVMNKMTAAAAAAGL